MPSPRMTMGRRAARILITAALSLVAGGTDLMERPTEPVAPPVLSEGTRDPRPAAGPARMDYPVPDDALFVSTTGDDRGDGSAGRPFRTLTRAVDRVSPGGTIVMRAGSYRESVPVIGKPVTIQPYPDEAVWLKGTDVQHWWTEGGGDWQASGWRSSFCHTCFDPRAIDPAFPQAGLPEQVFINGLPLRQVGSRWGVVSGTFYVDPTSRALFIGDNPVGVTVEISTRWRALQLDPGAAGSVIRGLGFAGYAPHWNEDELGAVIVNAAFVRIENNAFVQSSSTGLAVVHQPRVAVEGNVFMANGARGLMVHLSHDSVVRANRIVANNTERFANSGCGSACTAAGMKAVSVDNLVVDGNTVADNWSTGLWCDLGCTDTTIINNTVTGNFGNGIHFEVSSGAAIAVNTVTDNGRDPESATASGIKISGSNDAAIFANEFDGNIRQLAVYDDPRSPNEHPYSRNLGLRWDTVRTVVNGNRLIPGGDTSHLLVTNATVQVTAPQMFALMQDNQVQAPESQVLQWAFTQDFVVRYRGLSAFEQATGHDFGV